MSTEFMATAVWLRRMGENGNRVEVLVEIDGVWRLAITEVHDSNFSHIAEGNGVADFWLVDYLTEKGKR